MPGGRGGSMSGRDVFETVGDGGKGGGPPGERPASSRRHRDGTPPNDIFQKPGSGR